MHKFLQISNGVYNDLQGIPAAPADCKPANRLPAGTAPPYNDIQDAAHDPATNPEDVKPSRGRTTTPPTTPPMPTAVRQETMHANTPPTLTGNDSSKMQKIRAAL